MKPFKTHRQQLRILRDERGLTINDGSRAMRILERENYYALINGYKDLFLIKDDTNRPVPLKSIWMVHPLMKFMHYIVSIVI